MGQEEPEIAVVGTKGQIVIPQRLRKELAITPNFVFTERTTNWW
jgi:bifunctional DNA-binding transcriptional regulator/antitoxin component of YhaV-PrlF toxin-antitoxin module